jgi:HD-GYP domain-containing protein (c-di-GMP phosphodiesterase class II)
VRSPTTPGARTSGVSMRVERRPFDAPRPSVAEAVADPQRLAALRDLGLLDTASEQAFDRLTQLAVSTLDVPMAAVSLVDENRRFLKSCVGMPPGIAQRRETPLEGSHCCHVVHRGTALVIEDTRREPVTAGASPVPAGTRAYAGVPLTTPGGHVVGAFCVMDRIPRRWSERELDLLTALATLVMSEIELHTRRRRNRRRDEELEGMVSERTASLERANRFLRAARKDVSRSREETIRRLAGAIEARSGETGAHSHRMGVTCALLADRMDIDSSRVELIRMASPLHDVGKLAIPDSILNKPGPLSASERRVMETHAKIGHRMLAGSEEPLLQLAALVALTHHEQVDGQGYPEGLRGGDIPLEGRIAAVADVFDALTNDRVWRPAFTVEEAIEMMDAGRGTQFDPLVFDCLRDGLDQIPAAVGGRAVGVSGARRSPPRRVR